jgi:protein-S-isoprenylcysteine O-methyltransferase Ste14
LVGLPELDPAHPLRGIVDTGVYGCLRYPRYLLYMMMPLSMAFLTGVQAIFLLAILNILLYQMLTPLEERGLRDQYGPEYEEYQRTVPQFVPHFERKRQTRILF